MLVNLLNDSVSVSLFFHGSSVSLSLALVSLVQWTLSTHNRDYPWSTRPINCRVYAPAFVFSSAFVPKLLINFFVLIFPSAQINLCEGLQ